MFDESFWIAICFSIFVLSVYKPGKRIALYYLDDRIQGIQLHLHKLQEHNKQARSHLANVQKQLLSYRTNSKKILSEASVEANEIAQLKQKEFKHLIQTRRHDMQLTLTLRTQEAEYRLKQQAIAQAITLTMQYLEANPQVIPSSTLLIKRFAR